MNQKIFIDALSSEGEGIGSLDGLKVFLDDALPGEEVLIELLEKRKNYGKAKRLSLIKSSHQRVEPPCPLFNRCGGCQVMHLRYEEQLVEKTKRVKETLLKFGGLDVEVKPCLPSPTSLHYRNKIQLPIFQGKAGLYKKNTHEIIPIEKCYIQNEPGNEILHQILPLLAGYDLKTLLIRNGLYTHETLIILVSSGKECLKELGRAIAELSPQIVGVVENINPGSRNVILGTIWKTLVGRPYLYEQLKNKRFKVSAGAFFQVNTLQAESLFSQAIELASLKNDDVVWDAFCGVGTLALFASDRAAYVYGTECVESAIVDAQENARLNNATNCSFQKGYAEEMMKKIPTPHVIFLNPPRKGCEEKLLLQILKKKIERIVYISCDPATLARDLKLLSKAYKIKLVQPVDMFPQTMHVEILVLLH